LGLYSRPVGRLVNGKWVGGYRRASDVFGSVTAGLACRRPLAYFGDGGGASVGKPRSDAFGNGGCRAARRPPAGAFAHGEEAEAGSLVKCLPFRWGAQEAGGRRGSGGWLCGGDRARHTVPSLAQADAEVQESSAQSARLYGGDEFSGPHTPTARDKADDG